jgi:hypothetical protein
MKNMKTRKLILGIVVTLFASNHAKAQNWLTAGNVIAGTEFLGANAGSTVPLLFGTRAAQPINFYTFNRKRMTNRWQCRN